ncbi:MAG: redoxin domain-containing protein [Gemmatimonadetes bacterium]|nr:redoxin domain-containing protein [Gemmatimonadota bacterium]MYI62924.1 redoxin domain-containing protein [Gemmatimonadota bacterium]
MPRKNRILSIGDTAPLFTLPAHQQRDVSLASHREKEHVVLTFFRGTW